MASEGTLPPACHHYLLPIHSTCRLLFTAVGGAPHSTPVLSWIPVARNGSSVSFSPRIATSSSSPNWSVQCVWPLLPQCYCLRDCFYRGRFGQGSDRAADSSQRIGCRLFVGSFYLAGSAMASELSQF
jgi:hypothetical protein